MFSMYFFEFSFSFRSFLKSRILTEIIVNKIEFDELKMIDLKKFSSNSDLLNEIFFEKTNFFSDDEIFSKLFSKKTV